MMLISRLWCCLLALSSSLATMATKIDGLTISRGYQIPASSVGIDQQRYMLTVPAAAIPSRYTAVKEAVGAFVHKTTVYWHQVESVPLNNCTKPGGFLWPSNTTHQQQTGATAFHCYNTVVVKSLAAKFAADLAAGVESAVVVWGGPAFYVHPDCIGVPSRARLGCPPTPDKLAFFGDFFGFLAERFSSIRHFIVWNEADNSDWFDTSPFVDNIQKRVDNATAGAMWVDMYANLMRSAHQGLARVSRQPVMLYACIDTMLTATPWCPGDKRWGSRCPLGAWQLLDGLWARLGTSIDWSLAVHAYGQPNTSAWNYVTPYQAYTFKDIPKLITYQRNQMLKYSSGSFRDRPPQLYIAATEQGWPTSTPLQQAAAAHYVCLTADVAASFEEIIFASHYDFQDIYNKTAGGGNYGLVPVSAGVLLENKTAGTLQAFRALHPQVWGKRADHFCCSTHGIGCPVQLQPASVSSRSAYDSA